MPNEGIIAIVIHLQQHEDTMKAHMDFSEMHSKEVVSRTSCYDEKVQYNDIMHNRKKFLRAHLRQ